MDTVYSLIFETNNFEVILYWGGNKNEGKNSSGV